MRIVRVIARYWHTLRPLRWVQISGRVRLYLPYPSPDARPPPPLRAAHQRWLPCDRPPVLIGPARFQFLGVERSITTIADWNRSDVTRLWLYNLHYFNDWVAQDAEARRSWHAELISRWIAENPPGHGIGWEPYPTSLRIVNWIQWTLRGTTPNPTIYQSLAIQIRHLRHRLEFHLLGNHLWANAKALVFSGAYFTGPEADRWLRHGLALLETQMQETILEDGGQFERSPMYQAIVVADLLDLVQLGQLYPSCFPRPLVERWSEVSLRMLRWLRALTHPDGQIAFFNDATFGIAPDYAVLRQYAVRLGLEIDDSALPAIVALRDTGYYRLQSGDAVLVADLAPVGPDYQPGHAHADTLSFELSIGRKRVFVNGGISTYEKGPDREHQRGTAMHNTVVVDGQDSSEVWASFRVAHRARPRSVTCRQEGDLLWLNGAHDGYLRLSGRVIHARSWKLSTEKLQVVDTLTGHYREAQAYFHMAPGTSPVPMADLESQSRSREPGLQLRWRCLGASSERLETQDWYPGFGICMDAPVLVITFSGGRLETEFTWG